MDYRSLAELRSRYNPSDILLTPDSNSSPHTRKNRPTEVDKGKADSFSNALPDDPTALVREVPLAESLEALSAALEHDEAVQRHMESHNLSLEDSATYIMTNGSTGQKISFFALMRVNLEGSSPKRVMQILSIMVDSMWAQDPELQLQAPESLVGLLSTLDPATAGKIYEVTCAMLTVKTAQVREAWGRLLLALLNHLSLEQLEQNVIPLTFRKTEHAEPQDQRELSCMLLGALCKHLPTNSISSIIVPKALALCQDTNVSVRQHICTQLGVIARSLGIEAAETKIAPEIFELLNDEEHCVSSSAFSCLLDLVEVFGSQYRKEKLFPVIKSYMLNPTEFITLLVGDFGRFINEIKNDITTQEDVQLLANFFVTASQKLDDKAKWYCAFNFPAVAACLPLTVFPTHLASCLLKLSSNPVPEVRQSIAAGMHELVPILGDSAATYLEKPFLQLFTDTCWPVRFALFNHMDVLMKCFIDQLKPSQKKSFFRTVAEDLIAIASASGSNWRTMDQVIKILDPYIAQFDEGVLTDKVVPPLFTYILTGASSLKARSARVIIQATYRVTNLTQKIAIISKINNDFGRSSCCFQRQAYFHFLVEVCELFSSRFVRERMFDTCQELHRDTVAIVRLALAKSMEHLGKTVILANVPEVREAFSTMIQCLLMDEDTTVRETTVAAKEALDKLEVKYRRDPALKDRELAEDKKREQAELPMLEAAKESDKAERRAKLRDLLKTEREKDYMDPHSFSGNSSRTGTASTTRGTRSRPPTIGGGSRKPPTQGMFGAGRNKKF